MLRAGAATLCAFSCVEALRFAVTDDSYVTGSDRAVLKVLTNAATGEHVSILINGGGGIDELYLAPLDGSNVSLREVIWSYNRNATKVITNPTWQGRMLLPYANRIGGATYNFNGSRHVLPINDVAGLNNSLHGLLWNRSLQVISTTANDKLASLTIAYRFNSEEPSSVASGYPFQLGVTIEYVLTDGRFEIFVRAMNEDRSGWPLPFFHGWHPYFLCHPCADAYIVLDQSVPWRHVDVAVGPQFPPPRHSNMVPTGRISDWHDTNGSAPIGFDRDSVAAPRYMDDEVKAMLPSTPGFATRMVDPSTSQTVVLHHDRNMRYLQIFTGALTSFPNAPDAVVLEPLSAMSDAYNNHDGLHIISAGETYVSHFSVEVESLAFI